MDERSGLWISVADFLYMLRVMEAQQAMIDNLLTKEYDTGGQPCDACKERPRVGYKYCHVCKPVMAKRRRDAYKARQKAARKAA